LDATFVLLAEGFRFLFFSNEKPAERRVVKIEHLLAANAYYDFAMETKQTQALAVHCPACGAKPREVCALNTGMPRNEPHEDRRLAAKRR
jgi:hypothetical protein